MAYLYTYNTWCDTSGRVCIMTITVHGIAHTFTESVFTPRRVDIAIIIYNLCASFASSWVVLSVWACHMVALWLPWRSCHRLHWFPWELVPCRNIIHLDGGYNCLISNILLVKIIILLPPYVIYCDKIICFITLTTKRTFWRKCEICKFEKLFPKL